MSAAGELYIDETCRDVFEKELDALFGKGKWSISGCFNCNIDEVDEVQTGIEIKNDEDALIGEATIYSKQEWYDGAYGGELQLDPIAITVYDPKTDKVMYDGLKIETDKKYREVMDKFNLDLTGYCESDLRQLATIVSEINFGLECGVKRPEV